MTDHNEPLGFGPAAERIRFAQAMQRLYKPVLDQPDIPRVEPVDATELRKALAQLPVMEMNHGN